MSEDFADLFNGLRKKAGLVQAQIAEACGVAAQTVSAWEKGRGAPTGQVCLKLASMFGTDPVPLLEAAGRKRQRGQMPLEGSLSDLEGDRNEPLGSLAPVIRERRVKVRRTVEELAKACGVQPAAVKRWEEGGAKPSLEQAIALAQNLRMKTQELLELWARPGAVMESGERGAPVSPWATTREVLVYNIGAEFNHEWNCSPEKAGFPTYYRKISLPADDDAFACILRDGRMEPDLRQGDILLFAPSVEAHSGDFALIREPKAAFVRRVYFETDETSDHYLLSVCSRSEGVVWHTKTDVPAVHKMVGLFRTY